MTHGVAWARPYDARVRTTDASRSLQDAQEAPRVQGVRLVGEEGCTHAAVAATQGVHDQAIAEWMKRQRMRPRRRMTIPLLIRYS